MGLDDPFDDIFSDNAAKNDTRVGGKFQPKVKRGLTRKAATVPSSTSSQPVKTGLVPTKDEGCLESVKHAEDAASKECVNPSISAPPKSDVLKPECSSGFEKSVQENAYIFLGLESLEDFLPHSKAVVENSDPPSETPATPASQNAEDRLASPVISCVTDSVCVSNIADDPTNLKLAPAQDPLADAQPVVSVDKRGCYMHNGRLENEQIGSYSHMECLDISDLTTTSGQRPGIFHPKPKLQIHKERTEASTADPDTVEIVMGQMNAHTNPSELEYTDKSILSASPQDDVLDFSSSGLDYSIPVEPTSELPTDKQPGDLTEASPAEATSDEEYIEDVPEMHEKIATERAKTGEGRNLMSSGLVPDQENICTSNQGNEAGRVLRPRQKRNDGWRLVDMSEDEEPDGELSAEYPSRSIVSEASDEDFQVENEPEVKKHRRKSKKAVDGKEKPVRKRKRASEEPDQTPAMRPKKFSHSTRRKRRVVDKVLLETPENEIDFQKVPLRDIIILADYKEQIAKKEAAGLKAHLNTQSAGTTSMHCNEDVGFTSELGEAAYDGQESPRIQEDSSYINYQTYMDKTPRARWSKQDEELFYKALQQFGTDLYMVWQLFPGRTHKQIVNKYNREKHSHRSLVDEALTTRANDYSFYKLLIERQIAAEDKENSNKDESNSLVDDEEAEQIPETNEETTKSERQTEQGAEDGSGPDFAVQKSPVEDYESEGDLFDWSEYKSEV